MMGNWNTKDEEEEIEYGNDPYHGQKEEIEEDERGNGVNNDNGNKHKESPMPLWRYVARH